MKRIAITSLILVLNFGNPALARDKNDVVWMTNGDKFTGEIKKLEHGQLSLSTDSLGVVRIEWDDIARLESDLAFQFERSDGTRVTGIISKTTKQKKITLANQYFMVAFAHENIVRIAQIEESFWDRLQGSLSFGYSFTKASDVAQGNLDFRATHRTEERSYSLEGSSIVTSDEASESTQRSNLGFTMTRFRQNRWFNSYLLGIESNDELGLDLRSSIGAGFGRYIVQTNISELALTGGMIGTLESLDSDPSLPNSSSRQENIEGMLGVEYSRYVYDQPAVHLSAQLTAFPSITESGRTRSQVDLGLRWEIVSDLFWDLSYYNSYDSNPSSGADSTSDYGVVTSIGYSY
jgi:hypothetical protein